MFDQFNLSPEVIELFTILGTLAGAGALVALNLWVGKHITKQWRALWLTVRGKVPVVVAQVDEPTDAAIKALAKYLPVLGQIAPAFLPAFIKAFAKALDDVLDVPEQESAKTRMQAITRKQPEPVNLDEAQPLGS
jgi:hypothetical protein